MPDEPATPFRGIAVAPCNDCKLGTARAGAVL
jgi:hypothetical protein